MAVLSDDSMEYWKDEYLVAVKVDYLEFYLEQLKAALSEFLMVADSVFQLVVDWVPY